MIIVAGHLTVEPDNRHAILRRNREVMVAARSAPGCLAFQLSADVIEIDRINIFEQWENADAVERFRGTGPDDEQRAGIVDADVHQYDVTTSTSLS
ncbi:putative quinol monooxygenase [Actinospongicola halichondriae]|uniref:putative quinol monooxygenase n=1 Tax=Actinospongicola halichondriae TaxID=3236844 RepID=UPI003D3DD010